MEAVVIKKEDQLTSGWTGGSTTELFILPAGSKYSERNFWLRISSATVDAEEAVFTKLPQVQRVLLVLKGKIVLQHGAGKRMPLNPFDIHAFDGGEPTVSRGRCVDFNVMTRDNVHADLCTYQSRQMPVPVAADHFMHFFYAFQGDFCLTTESGKQDIPEKALLYVPQADCPFSVSSLGAEEAVLVHVKGRIADGVKRK
ncbi:HutD family protein|uniref:Various environmental stresses-induced protein Ves n=1 Tax=Dendrosporobacter quercicolus TaxID=146817 RepID=A0A1G9SLQ0_9FIRM|nr:HutD family protein [Dendrosporobacter quercicolus]NSL48677.1 HutD family protein [Dendrosporobacter quercicolus DSM 1736]SDM36349.1 Various environmental stresses-induced protein Ves [Dendrosporobacter quercicolus]